MASGVGAATNITQLNPVPGTGKPVEANKPGTLGEHTVEQTSASKMPPQLSGIGARIADFFSESLPNFFKSAGRAIAGFFTPAPKEQKPAEQSASQRPIVPASKAVPSAAFAPVLVLAQNGGTIGYDDAADEAIWNSYANGDDTKSSAEDDEVEAFLTPTAKGQKAGAASGLDDPLWGNAASGQPPIGDQAKVPPPRPNVPAPDEQDEEEEFLDFALVQTYEPDTTITGIPDNLRKSPFEDNVTSPTQVGGGIVEQTTMEVATEELYQAPDTARPGESRTDPMARLGAALIDESGILNGTGKSAVEMLGNGEIKVVSIDNSAKVDPSGPTEEDVARLKGLSNALG